MKLYRDIWVATLAARLSCGGAQSYTITNAITAADTALEQFKQREKQGVFEQ